MLTSCHSGTITGASFVHCVGLNTPHLVSRPKDLLDPGLECIPPWCPAFPGPTMTLTSIESLLKINEWLMHIIRPLGSTDNPEGIFLRMYTLSVVP